MAHRQKPAGRETRSSGQLVAACGVPRAVASGPPAGEAAARAALRTAIDNGIFRRRRRYAGAWGGVRIVNAAMGREDSLRTGEIRGWKPIRVWYSSGPKMPGKYGRGNGSPAEGRLVILDLSERSLLAVQSVYIRSCGSQGALNSRRQTPGGEHIETFR